MEMALLKQILFIIALIGLVISILWEIKDGGYEPLLGIFGAIATIIGLYISNRNETSSSALKQQIINTDSNSGNNQNIQAEKIEGGNFANKIENHYYNSPDSGISKDINEQTKLLEQQKQLTIESSKPILKDVKISIKQNKFPSFSFSILTKNYGHRPAEKIKMQWIFFKLNSEGQIESHGKQTTEEEQQYQNTLNPNEEWTFTTMGNLQGGLNDLNSVITRLEFNYYDDAVKKRFSSFYYYGFKIESQEINVFTLNLTQKGLIEKYMAGK